MSHENPSILTEEQEKKSPYGPSQTPTHPSRVLNFFFELFKFKMKILILDEVAKISNEKALKNKNRVTL